jgi:hypothetical protein
VRRRCHERVGGFPKDDVFRIPGFEGGVFLTCARLPPCGLSMARTADIFYTTLLLNRCADAWLPAETVQYVRRPGNTLDRNLPRYQTPPTASDVNPSDDPDWPRASRLMADALGTAGSVMAV